MQESFIIVASAFIDCQRQIREKNMLTQFRNHYPHGSIVSELVAVEYGKYVVRTLIQIEGVTLASGLAAADTVEQAEDRARERSLAILDLSAPSAPPAPQVQEAPASAHVPLTSDPTTTDFQPSVAPADTEVIEAPPEQKDALSQNGFQLSQPEPEPLEEPEQPDSFEDFTSVETMLPTPPAEQDELSFDEELEPPPPASPPAPASSQWSQPDPVANGPIDFSDVIAKTNVEMKRLGWTNEQGRKYLLETYGKRSRQLLSDEELLDFLRYLEGL